MRNYIRKGNRQTWSRQAMARAITACLNGNIGYLKASKLFNIPRSTLKNRIKRAKCGKTIAEAAGKKLRYNTVFTEEQEKQLMSYLLEMEPQSYELTALDLRKIAYRFAQQKRVKHNFNHNKETAGFDWLRGFIARHPDISFFITKTSRTTKWSKHSVSLLIDLYKDNDCLYDINLLNFHNTKERKKAFENIIEQLQNQRPGTTEAEVKTKLECLTSAYLALEKKLEASLDAGHDTVEMYTPSLWFYEKLSFLASYTAPSKNSSAMASEVSTSCYDDDQTPCFDLDNIKTEEAEISIDSLNQAIGDSSDQLVFTQLDSSFLLEIQSPSALESIQTRPTVPRQYPSPKSKRATEIDPLEIPPADGLQPSEATTSKPSESTDQFISYISARMKRISCKDILQELEDEIILKVMQAEKEDRKRQKEF